MFGGWNGGGGLSRGARGGDGAAPHVPHTRATAAPRALPLLLTHPLQCISPALITQVHSFGACRKNQPDIARNNNAGLYDTLARYRFCVAMENTVAPDYVSEKVYRAFSTGWVGEGAGGGGGMGWVWKVQGKGRGR